jgi:hypothetical protein
MGRPRATRGNRDFATSFATFVTAFAESRFEWIARKGRHGIFELLKNLAPKARAIEINVIYGYLVWN